MPKLTPRLCLVLLGSLSACGLRGPLYLPEPAKPVETPVAQPTTTDAHADAESDQQSDDEKKSRPATPSETQRR